MRSCKTNEGGQGGQGENDEEFSFEEPVPVIEATSLHEQSM